VKGRKKEKGRRRGGRKRREDKGREKRKGSIKRKKRTDLYKNFGNHRGRKGTLRGTQGEGILYNRVSISSKGSHKKKDPG